MAKSLKVRGGIFGVLKRLYWFIKKVFGDKVFIFALENGAEAYLKIDIDFGGPLDKEKYQTKTGAWKKGGEAAYVADKEKRQAEWHKIMRALIEKAFPKATGLTSLLLMTLGMLGTEKKKQANDEAEKKAEEAVKAEKKKKKAQA